MKSEIQFNWIFAKDSLPPIDKEDDLNLKYRVSIRVATYSKEFGVRFGRFHYMTEWWILDWVSYPVEVEQWLLIPEPKI